MINSRNIDDLIPGMAQKCREFIAGCAAAGLRVLITSTYRDVESQNACYAQGRTVPGRKITNCQGGDSYHNYRVAFDFVPLDLKGQPDWSVAAPWQQCGAIGEGVGLEWGGSWDGFVDKPHFQIPGMTIEQLKGEHHGQT